MNEPRQRLTGSVLAGTCASELTFQRARGPPLRAIYHIILKNTYALPIDKFKEYAMTKFRTTTVAIAALLSVSFLASRVEAAEGIMMKDGKMMMMKDGKATGPMNHEMTLSDGHKVMPDGTMKMPDGIQMRMKEGEMMTMDGKMMEGRKGMQHSKGMGMEGGKGTKMDGMK